MKRRISLDRERDEIHKYGGNRMNWRARCKAINNQCTANRVMQTDVCDSLMVVASIIQSIFQQGGR